MALRDLLTRARELAGHISEIDEVLVVTHIDADGITAGAVALQALERAGFESEILFVKQLDEERIESIADRNTFVWFTDLGSGQLDLIRKHQLDSQCIISDHHEPLENFRYQLNPHDFGFDGSTELSGATTTYLIAKHIGFASTNRDLSALSIVGAVGDLQDSRTGRLEGLNRIVLKEATSCRVLAVERDLRFFGKQTRPVYKMLEYTFDPYLPGISGNEKGAIELLSSLGIELKENGTWKHWIHLSRDEKKLVISEIVKVLVGNGASVRTIERIVGETYILLNEEEGTELRDAMEFSTLLNATARYGYEEIGLKVCMGDRGEALKEATMLLRNHRRNLSDGLKLVDEIGMSELENIQYFHAGNMILDTIVGIVAGMSFSKANLNKPIIAFAENEDGIKVSARATQRLVERGVHLAEALRIAAEKIGGKGGGHSIAAGATIPKGSEEVFLKELDRIVGAQLRS